MSLQLRVTGREKQVEAVLRRLDYCTGAEVRQERIADILSEYSIWEWVWDEKRCPTVVSG
ncbi:hypothetical protein E2C01_078213 [Portunus trituberculatus]|uniref:Uncharacterized protein n=1 Tax=Portunus trituberculatus TaxID=210409 RepID=A0A5B7IDE2_PORTR|nr:hypothetical protein [Portunus trituberculatus]